MRKIVKKVAFYALLVLAILLGMVALQNFAVATLYSQELPAQTLAPTLHDPPTGRGEDLTIRIALFGPGTELYFWWGHIAMIIDDAATGRSYLYDYGLFFIEGPGFFTNFALGRLVFSTGRLPTWIGFANYMNTNRDIIVYTLDLPPEKREMVLRQAEWDVLPENSDYLYHHFRHNCVTPLLYIIDMATNGQFQERFANEPGRFTLRQHVRRHTWHSPFLDWILNFWMGQVIDTPITAWEEMFLPSEAARNIIDFEFVDSDGVTRRLVSDREEVFMSYGRPHVLEAPLVQWPRQLVFSLILSLVLGGLFFVQLKKSPALGQVALGICHSLFGLLFGGAGLMLFFLSNFTEHDYTFGNANILFSGPLLLALVPLGIRYAIADNYHKRLWPEFWIRVLWLLVVLGIFASMLIKLTPWFWQDNLTDQMLMLPIALVLSFEPLGLRRMLRRIFWRWL